MKLTAHGIRNIIGDIIKVAGLSPCLSFHWVARGANVAALAKWSMENKFVGYFLLGILDSVDRTNQF